MNSSCRRHTWIAVLTIAFVLIVDQIIKISIKTGMYIGEKIEVTNWFHITFTENKGMAFGMDFAGTMVLALFRIVAVGFFLYGLRNLITKQAKTGVIVCWAFIVAGAAGNIIDNSLYGLLFTESGYSPSDVASLTTFGQGYGTFLSGRVVDMFYFPLFTWPEWVPFVGGNTFFGAIFNFADAAISCGAVALLLFYHRDISIDYIFRKPKPEE